MAAMEPAEIVGYHAHVYFDAKSRDAAWILRERIEAAFEIEMGRFHEKPVGPHPCWSYQVKFGPEQFGNLVPWFLANRAGLDILVHGLSGNDLRDHTDHVLWLGKSHELDLSVLP